MEINDTLNILNLTQAEITALGSVDAGTIVYNSTTNALETYNGTAWVASGGGGKEGYIVPITLYPFQVTGQDGPPTPLLANRGLDKFTCDASPMVFNQDVNLKEIVVNVKNSTSGNFTGYFGVYELSSKATTSGDNYYNYTKVQQFTPTVTFTAGGTDAIQILTISPNFKFIAGKVYVVVGISDRPTTSGAGSVVAGVRGFGANKLLGFKPNGTNAGYRALQASVNLPSPYTLSFTPPTLPTSIWFQEISTTSAANPFTITVQNA